MELSGKSESKELDMMDHFHDPGDIRLLKEMKELAPEEYAAWSGLMNILKREDAAIPRKYRELIAVGVACTTQCPYCVEIHAREAKSAGATRKEVVEATFIAAAMRSGGAGTHGTMALKCFDRSAEPKKQASDASETPESSEEP